MPIICGSPVSADDRIHRRALARYDELAGEGRSLVTNNYVVDGTARGSAAISA